MKGMKKKLLVIIFLLLDGCSSNIERTIYTLTPPTISPESNANYVKVEIRIKEFDEVPPYNQDSLIYRVSDVQLKTWRYHRWGGNPGVLLTNYFSTSFERSGKFMVLNSNDLAPLELQGTVETIEEIDTPDKWYGHISIKLRMIKTDTGEVVWRGRVGGKRETKAKNPEEVVNAINYILNDSIQTIFDPIYETARRVIAGDHPVDE